MSDGTDKLQNVRTALIKKVVNCSTEIAKAVYERRYHDVNEQLQKRSVLEDAIEIVEKELRS